MVLSPWRQSGWSPVGSLLGTRGSMVGRICGTNLEWKWGEVMVETDDERRWRNEAGRLFQRLCDNGKSDLWFWVKKMRVDERWWCEMTNECDKETEQRSVGIERWRESCMWERILYSMRSLTFSQWRDLRIGVVWENLGALTTARAKDSSGCVEAAMSGGYCNILTF